jgi:antitoxin MazE
MRTELIRIGNSRGVRIPKPLIEECGLGETVELRVLNRRIVVSPVRAPREGWDEAFRKAGPSTHDELLLDLPESEFDREEWQW